jgi:hypothetical protein
MVAWTSSPKTDDRATVTPMEEKDITLLAQAIATKEPLSERVALIQKLLSDLGEFVDAKKTEEQVKTKKYVA